MSAASSPRNLQPSDPGCNQASSYPHPAHQSWPDAWAKHYLDIKRDSFTFQTKTPILRITTRQNWPHWRGILDTREVWHLIIKSSANRLITLIRGLFLYTFKQTLGVLFVKSEQLSGSFANLSQGEFDPPDLTLVPQSILTWKDEKINNLCCYDYYLKYPSSFNCSVNEITYQWALTPGQDGTSQRDGGGWRMSCDKPSSWQRAWRLRCAYNSKPTIFILPILQLFSNLNLNPENPALIWLSIST